MHRHGASAPAVAVVAAVTVLALGCAPSGVSANDPAGSWLSYASYKASGRITNLNTTWHAPNKPTNGFGSNAPGWWFGVQDADGNGALIQPILAWGYQGDVYTIFNGVYDWTAGGGWHTFNEFANINPGDEIFAAVNYKATDNSYDLLISSGKQTLKANYKLLSGQTEKETVAYFVLEHQPDSCDAYPPDGVCTFENIQLAVAGKLVTPTWTAHQEQPACSSKATVVDSSTIKFTWDANGSV